MQSILPCNLISGWAEKVKNKNVFLKEVAIGSYVTANKRLLAVTVTAIKGLLAVTVTANKGLLAVTITIKKHRYGLKNDAF